MLLNILLAIAGLALVAIGIWLVYPPAALVVVGTASAAFALLRDTDSPVDPAETP